MKFGILGRICIGLVSLLSPVSLSHAVPIVYPADSGMIDVTQAPYNADKTGATDATAAIQAAVTANIYQNPTRTIYFPAGTYMITNTINCVNSAGQAKHRMSFQGAGQGQTILKLTSNNPNFQSTTTPAGVIHLNNITGNAPNDGLENNVWDMTVDVGSGNPGAIGLDWCACNLATIRNVTIQSSDPAYAGTYGLYCDGWPGPCLVKNVTVVGFGTGIYVRSNQLGVTMDTVTLSHQTIQGIYNGFNAVFLRNVTSTNAVPAVYAGSGLTVMANCNLTGTSTTVPAISAVNTNAAIYLRNVATSGYSALVKAGTTVMQSAGVPTGEYSSQPTKRLFNNAEAGLMIDPTIDAPDYHDTNLAHWASVVAFGGDATGVADSTAAVQAAINSGATTVYFPMGTYRIGGTVNVNGAVVRIFGNQSVILASAPATNTAANPGIIFNIQNGTSSYVILDRLFIQDAGGIYNEVNQATTRQVVIRDTNIEGFSNSVTGGTLFLQNTQSFTGTLDHMTAYAWQLDTEVNYPKIVNKGGNLWILGLKTETSTTAIQTIAGGKTEVLGGFIFSNSPTWNTPIFINNNSQFFGSFTQFNSASPGWPGLYADMLREIQGTVTKDLRAWDNTTPVASYSNKTGTPVHAVPVASISSPTDGQVFTAPANITINSTASASVGTLTNYVLEVMQPLQAQNAANILATSAPSYTWSNVPAGNYTFYVKATDNANVVGYSNPIHITVKPNLASTGSVLREYWEANAQHWTPASLTGLVSQLQILPAFISDIPDLITFPTTLSATSPGRNVGMRIHGYIQPPTTGSYTFSISSSNCGALWMTTDAANPGNIANRQLIAINDVGSVANVWTTANSSDPIPLTAGLKYYFEAVQAYSNGGNTPHVEVAWQGPGITQQVIPGANLLPFDPTVSETQASAPAGTLYPEADAYTRGGGTSNTNYGSAPDLNVAGTTFPAGGFQTFSRYNLSGVAGTITHAVLWMYVDSTVAGDSHILQMATQPAGDAWSENGLKYNNEPALNTTSTAGPWTPLAGQWVQVDVTSLVQSAYASDPNKRFSFGIVHTGSVSAAGTTYSSKEDVRDYWPHLVLTTTANNVVLNNYMFASGSVASNDTDANSTAGNFLAGSGYTAIDFPVGLIQVTAPGISGNTALQDYNAGEYFSFSTTAVTGKTLHLASTTINVRRAQSSPGFCTVFAVPNGGPASGQLLTVLNEVVVNGNVVTPYTADLSGANYQGINSITFYIVFDGVNQGVATARDSIGSSTSVTGAAY